MLFDSSKASLWTEADAPPPCDLLGHTKVAGEGSFCQAAMDCEGPHPQELRGPSAGSELVINSLSYSKHVAAGDMNSICSQINKEKERISGSLGKR